MRSFFTILSFSSLALAVTCNAGHRRSSLAASQSTSSQAAEPTTSSSSNAVFKAGPGSTFVYAINDPSIPAKAVNAQFYDVDLFDTSAATISGYHSQGKKVICYFSAGSFENWRSDKASFDKACYCNGAKSCALDGWDGEWWLDLHSQTCIANIHKVMAARIALAKSKGCNAVDPDNVDSYEQGLHYGTTAQDQFNYATFLSTTARSSGMGIMLKNSPDMISKFKSKMVDLYDGSIIEQCQKYDECDSYLPFTQAGKAAFAIEYGNVPVCNSKNKGFEMLQYNKNQALSYKNLISVKQC